MDLPPTIFPSGLSQSIWEPKPAPGSKGVLGTRDIKDTYSFTSALAGKNASPAAGLTPQGPGKPAGLTQRAGRVRDVIDFKNNPLATATNPPKLQNLVAGKVTLSPRAALSELVPDALETKDLGQRPRVEADLSALPMYRNPADKNAAATGVTLGKRVDVTG